MTAFTVGRQRRKSFSSKEAGISPLSAELLLVQGCTPKSIDLMWTEGKDQVRRWA